MTAGWQAKVLPWVVGIRGLVIEDGIHSALEFIGLQRKDWAAAVTITVVASVESLAFMHRCFSLAFVRAKYLIPMILGL